MKELKKLLLLLVALNPFFLLAQKNIPKPTNAQRAWHNMEFYLFMHFVLVIAAAVIFGIIGVIVSLILLAPIIGVVVAAIVGGGAAGLSWTPFTITLAVVAGVLLFLPLMYVLSFVRTPGTVFFPAYAMHFFAGRYEPLGMILYPPPPPVVQPLPPVFAPLVEVPVEPSVPEPHVPDAGTPPEDGGAGTI